MAYADKSIYDSIFEFTFENPKTFRALCVGALVALGALIWSANSYEDARNKETFARLEKKCLDKGGDELKTFNRLPGVFVCAIDIGE